MSRKRKPSIGVFEMKTTEEKKPREFKLSVDEIPWVDVIETPDSSELNNGEIIHVIEKSAYESLSKELAAEKEKVRKLKEYITTSTMFLMSQSVQVLKETDDENV
jgi:hypothetical protein